MKPYNHDSQNVNEACNISEETVDALRETIIFDFMDTYKKTSIVVEKLETMILKDPENYLRPFLVDYISVHSQNMSLIDKALKGQLSGLTDLLKKVKDHTGECDTCTSDCTEE